MAVKSLMNLNSPVFEVEIRQPDRENEMPENCGHKAIEAGHYVKALL